MASYIVPAQRTGFQEFSEAFQPGLERAFQMAFQKKLEEQQYQKAMERNRVMFPELFQEEIAPQGYERLKPYLREGGDITPQENIAQAQARLPKGIEIPKQYRFMSEKARGTPGLELKTSPEGYPQLGYSTPSSGIFNNITLDAEGNPALKIGDMTIPVRSFSKTGATFKTQGSGNVQQEVLRKIQNNEELTPQDLQIYNEVVRRVDPYDEAIKAKIAASLGITSAEQPAETTNNELIEAINPKGQRTRIRKSQLPDAIKQGYKLP